MFVRRVVPVFSSKEVPAPPPEGDKNPVCTDGDFNARPPGGKGGGAGRGAVAAFDR